MVRPVGSKGSTLVETAVALSAWWTLLAFAIPCMAWAHTRVWTHYVMYEALMCAAEQTSLRLCQQQAEREAALYLPYLGPIHSKITASNRTNLSVQLFVGEGILNSKSFELSMPAPDRLIQ